MLRSPQTALLIFTAVLFSCSKDSSSEPAEELGSKGQLALDSGSELEFHAAGETLSFRLDSGHLSQTSGDVLVFAGDTLLPDGLVSVTDARIHIDVPLVDGPNAIEVYASDSGDGELHTATMIWAGSESLTVTVVDENGAPANGVQVVAALGDDQRVRVTASSQGGLVKFEHLPTRTLILSATATGNRFASAAVAGDAGSVTLKLTGLSAPSPVANNDFRAGLDGWNTTGANVSLVQHVEPTLPGALTAPNTDLLLSTAGEGPQSVSRTFVAGAGAHGVKLRYRFVTSEVPGGFFGSEFNDYFNVTLRNQTTGVISESNSMNGLGLGAFDSNGNTDWRDATLPVEEGDTIQADVTVANVADALYDSSVIVDAVEETKLSIVSLELADIDNTRLQQISVDDHEYFDGNTRVHGTIDIEGAEEEALSSIELQVVQGGEVVARGELAPTVKSKLLTTFGAEGHLAVEHAERLFDLPAAQAARVDTTQDGTVSLRVVATSTSGETASKDLARPVEVLARYKGANRYGGRDEELGGDDWGRPSSLEVAEHYSGVTIGDISNMNGGAFAPHASHQIGADIDAFFPGYDPSSAATAQTLIEQLNDPEFGSRIAAIFATYAPTSAFAKAISDAELADGRLAKDVIRSVKGHKGHFHWRVTGASP
jgi:hypothetical protein